MRSPGRTGDSAMTDRARKIAEQKQSNRFISFSLPVSSDFTHHWYTLFVNYCIFISIHCCSSQKGLWWGRGNFVGNWCWQYIVEYKINSNCCRWSPLRTQGRSSISFPFWTGIWNRLLLLGQFLLPTQLTPIFCVRHFLHGWASSLPDFCSLCFFL